MERSELEISLNHEVMASFALLMYQILTLFGPCNSIRVQPYAL